MPPTLLPFWLIRVVWCPLAGPVVALCVPRPCVMKMFHAPVERNTVDPSCPVHRSKTAPVKIKKTVQKWCRNGAVLNPTAEMHFTEGSQGNEGTRLSVGNGPDPKSSVLRCFRWNRGEAEKSARDILEGCQKVAGGRAKRYPRFRRGKKSHPGGVPEPVFCAENLASRRDAGVAAQHRRSVSSRASKQNCTGQNQKSVQKWYRKVQF